MILENGNHFVSAIQMQRANRESYDRIPISEKATKRRSISEYWNLRHAIEDYISHMNAKGERDGKV